MAGNEGARAASRRVGGFEGAGEVARRALRLDPAECIHRSELHAPAGSSDFRKKSEPGTSSDGRSRRSLRGFSADTTRFALSRPRGLSSAGERICAARSKQRNVDLLNQIAEVNRQRYEVGKASQAEVR